MSYDLTLLGDDDFELAAVAIGLNEHHELMEGARALGLHVLLKAHNYYEDAEFTTDELETLLHEVILLRQKSAPAETSVKVLSEIEALVRRALAERRPLVGLSD